MKKTNKILALVLVVTMMLVSVFAITASAAAGQTWTVAGESGLCGSNWDTADTNNDMTYDSETDSYVKVFYNVSAGTYQFKCAKDHGWNTSYPSSNKSVTVSKDGSTVTVTLKGTSVTVTVEEPSCDHQYAVTESTVTCTTAGSETYTCSVCGDTYSKDLAALGHHYGADGKCERCGATTTFTRVYVDNAANWTTVYCYVWDTNPYVSWPGEAMTLGEDGLYYYDIPAGFVNVIFTNNSVQSADLKAPTTSAVVYNNSTKTWGELPHTHVWSDATCTEPQKCECGETQGEALGHSYSEGVCSVCGTPDPDYVAPHVNALVVGQTNKIVVDGSVVNDNGNPIAWVAFTVEEKAHYAFTSETEGTLVFIFDTSVNLLCGGTGAAVLEPGTYLVCIGNGAVGEILVTATKTEIPTECEHVYVYMNCSLCGELNPHFAYNLMTVGTNNVVCNEYHLVDTTGHGNPYQFTTFTVTEAGHYKFTCDKLVGITIFTTEVSAEGADWTAGTGASWGVYVAGNEVDLDQPGTYYIGLIFVDGLGEYTITLEKVEQTPDVDDPVVDPNEPAGDTDNTPTEEPELNFFQKILAWFMELINKLLALFKK